MVNTDKRQRHKEGHRSRVEAAREAEVRRRRRRTIAVVGTALVAVAAVFAVVIATGDDDDDQKVTAGATSTAPATTAAPAGVSLPTPPDGRTIDAPTPCPKENEERAIAFEEAPPRCIDPKKAYRATITTSKGEIVVDLDAAQSPIAVNNFVVLSRYHYYDEVPFHRIVTGFVDQTGSSGRPDFGTGGPGYTLPEEKPTKPYEEGTVAMAQGEEVSGSQFFFTLDPAPLEGGGYPILGKITEESLAVVKEINTLGSESENGEPTAVVTIDEVEISES